MEAKYFSAPDLDVCYEHAEAYFQINRDNLYCRPLPAMEGEGFILMAVNPGDAGLLSLENMDASFRMRFEPEGVILEVFEARGKGKRLLWDELEQYLRRKNVKSLNMEMVKLLANQGWGFSVVAPPQEETVLNEEVSITTDPQETRAFLTIIPGDAHGQKLDKDAVRLYLTAAGITHGIDERAIDDLLQERRPHYKYTVANTVPPQRGKDGQLIFHFRREFTGRPKIDEEGRVDYKMLDLFENVSAGQELVTRTPAEPGIPGYTVKGREIAAESGKEVRMPSGKNIKISEDGLKMTASVGGMVVYSGNQINVSNVYFVSENVDMTVGHIDFDGSVVVSGNVISGITIKAAGNIEVGGVVESASLIAGGNIVLKRGIQGAGKGILHAGGNITANYIERATVLAGGTITANIIQHSTVEAGDCLRLTGQNGSLVGGFTRASNTVSAMVIGSLMEMATEVEVGLVPHKRERIRFLHNDLKRIKTEVEKLATIIEYLDRNPSQDEKKQTMRVTVSQSLQFNTQLFEEYTEEYNTLTEESNNAIHGKVHVSNIIHPGVRLTIANAIYTVLTPTEHCSFRVSEGDVVMGSYEG